MNHQVRQALGPIATVLAVTVALSALWNLPVRLDELVWTRLARVSLEIVVLLVCLALVRPLREGRTGAGVAVLVGAATAVVAVVKAADLAMQEILGRPLNPILDVRVISPVVQLLTETLGKPLGWAASAALVVAPLAVGVLAAVAVRRAQLALRDRPTRAATMLAGLAFVALFAVQRSMASPAAVVLDDASQALLRYTRAAQDTWRGIADVEQASKTDRFRDMPPSRMLARLRGADVLVVFFESYGRSALELPRYASTVGASLDAFERQLASRGLSSASTWLTSPTIGGLSWLAAGTFSSGLWLSDQARYDAAMQSGRLTLVRAFSRAGYRTVALKPAIVRPWPEGSRLGFSQVYAAADLGYAGKPYNWITMPDQYTLSALERDERSAASRPLFAEVSLISSHTPWTPIAEVLDWSTIGDGRVFSQWAEAGLTPDEVWSDVELMRVQYGRAVDYVLRVLASYAGTFVNERTLLIVVGDHQAPPYISVDGADVPIHVISGDPALVAPFRSLGFAPGMRPAPGVKATRMDAFRDLFLDAFSD